MGRLTKIDLGIAVGIAAVFAIMFAAWEWRQPVENTGLKFVPSGGISVWLDPETGCEYVSRGDGGLTPRLGPDGKQLCDAQGRTP